MSLHQCVSPVLALSVDEIPEFSESLAIDLWLALQSNRGARHWIEHPSRGLEELTFSGVAIERAPVGN
jgi:hypothetical protein